MDDTSRLKLESLIKEYNVEETTGQIRTLKHSKQIRENMFHMETLKKSHARVKATAPETFRRMCEKQCSFLYNKYTNIFNRLYKDELDLNIMEQFLTVLYNIEEGIIDQHEGSFKVGMILKELYIDSALKQDKKRVKQDKRKKSQTKAKAKAKATAEKNSDKNISWNEYKQIYTMD